jgi:molecular chaperone GrpE
MAEGEEPSSEQQEFQEPSSEEVIAIWRDKYMRLQAEFDNYRKRTLREKMDLISTATTVIGKMLDLNFL